MRYHMHVYVNGVRTITETNVKWALPFWQERKRARERDGQRITWRFVPA